MKISINDQELFTLNEIQRKVIMNDIHEDDFDGDMKRRLEYIIMHKYERCFDRLKREWEPKLAQKERNITSVPLDKDAFAKLVFSQPDYQDRKKREEAAKTQEK